MALRDYILCSSCECKLIYDGDDNARWALEQEFGDEWRLYCPKCLDNVLNECATLRKKIDAKNELI